MFAFFCRIMRNEQGATFIEYALIALLSASAAWQALAAFSAQAGSSPSSY